MSRKHVLIAAHLHGPGGVETHLLQLVRLLVGQGAEVTVVARIIGSGIPLVETHREIPMRLLTTPFSRSGRSPRASMAWGLWIWPLQLGRGFDVLYTLDMSRLVARLAPLVKAGGYVLGGRVGEPPADFQFIDRRSHGLLDGLIVESPIQAQAYKTHFPVAAIPLLGYYSRPPRRQVAASEPLRIAYLGRYDKGKGMHRLLDIWPQLSVQPARLDFYGQGAERPAMEETVRARGFGDNVRIHGGWTQASELSAIFEKVDLMVMPSDTEGLPVLLLEAMAHGVPFVASDVGGVRSLAEENRDVRVVPLENAALIHATNEMAAALRKGAIRPERLQHYHQAHYSYERVCQQWMQALLEPELFWGRIAHPGPAGSALPAVHEL